MRFFWKSLALVLSVVSDLMLRSLYALTHVELGFDPKGVLTARIDLPEGGYADPHRIQGFFNALLDRVRTLPAVQSAGLIDHRPIVGGQPHRSFTIPGRPEPEPGKMPVAAVATVSPEALAVLRISVLRGRGLS